MPTKPKGIVRDTDKGTEVRCPNCGQWYPIEKYRSYTLNPHYVTELAPVLQCQGPMGDRECLHIFAPIELVFKMRTEMLAGVEQK